MWNKTVFQLLIKKEYVQYGVILSLVTGTIFLNGCTHDLDREQYLESSLNTHSVVEIKGNSIHPNEYYVCNGATVPCHHQTPILLKDTHIKSHHSIQKHRQEVSRVIN